MGRPTAGGDTAALVWAEPPPRIEDGTRMDGPDGARPTTAVGLGDRRVLTLAFGVLLFAGGFGLRLLARRREFYRTNQAGLLTFENYRASLGFRASNYAIRWGARMAMIFGLGFALMGLVLMGDARDQRAAGADGASRAGSAQGGLPR